MRFVLPLAFALAALPVMAQELVGPRLGAASNFGQGWDADMLDAAQALGVRDLRDGVYWRDVEQDGARRFDTFRTAYPALLEARGMGMSLTVNNGHPDYDGGVTPHTPEGVAGFADHAAALVRRYPAIDAVEVGNEMNSATFTSGPMRAADLAGRAVFYTRLLAATRAAVTEVRPDLRILGGAAHSIPLAWFRALSDAGAPAHMDAVVVHPYTTLPEHFGRQVALLRGVPGFADLPIEVTEFGDEDAATAPATLIKYHCKMALAGVTRAVWYPLNPRGDGLAPLIGADDEVTAVGRAFALADRHLAGRTVRDVSPDPFTHACLYDDRALVIWGEPRALSVADGIEVLGPDGESVEDPALDRVRPLVLLAQDRPVIGETVTLGPQDTVADSFHQFAYPGQDGDGFRRFTRIGGEEAPFALRGGQQANGVPWTPYLGSPRDGMLRMDGVFLLPSGDGNAPGEVVHEHVVAEALRGALDIHLAPSERTTDGIVARVTLNGAEIDRRVVIAAADYALGPLDLAQGDVLRIIVGPGDSARGDATRYRFTLRRAPAP